MIAVVVVVAAVVVVVVVAAAQPQPLVGRRLSRERAGVPLLDGRKLGLGRFATELFKDQVVVNLDRLKLLNGRLTSTGARRVPAFLPGRSEELDPLLVAALVRLDRVSRCHGLAEGLDGRLVVVLGRVAALARGL